MAISLRTWLFAHAPSIFASRVMFVGTMHSTTFSHGVGVPFCIDVSSNSESAVLLLVRGEDYEETYYEALPHGVMTLSRPVSRARPVWRFVGEAGAAGGDAVFLQIAPGAGCRVDVEALLAEHLAGRQQVGFLDGVAR